jgi:hypothetical protein
MTETTETTQYETLRSAARQASYHLQHWQDAEDAVEKGWAMDAAIKALETARLS